jgi:hypothetical protein
MHFLIVIITTLIFLVSLALLDVNAICDFVINNVDRTLRFIKNSNLNLFAQAERCQF